MSKFNKRGLVVAVAAAMVMPAAAMAANAGYPAGTTTDQYTFASNLFGASTSTISNPLAYSINTVATDNIIGRTTGFGIRLTLGNGVLFANSTVAPAAGAALTNYVAPALGAPIPAGGSAVLVISVTPSSTLQPNVGVGPLVTWAAGDLDLRNLGALASTGGSVPVTIELFDSNTAQVFQTIQGASLATSVEGTTVVIDPLLGDTAKRIDVATCASSGATQASKTRFSPSGVIGASCTAADTDRTEFNAGAIVLGVRGLANGFAGANNSGNPGAGTFQYDVAADLIDVTVSGVNFSAFNAPNGNDRVYLSNTPNCDVAGAFPSAPGTRIIAGNSSVTFETQASDWSATGGTKYVCFATTVAAATQIAAQDLEASVAITLDDAAVISPADRGGPLLPLKNNGTVLEFQNVNPAANPRAQSFIRLTNNGSIACPVTLTAKDDNGAAGASAVALTLAVGTSTTLNSEDLENGSSKATGAFGDGVGRWYVTADGECAGLVGSALNRNLEDGTVTNLTPDKR